MTVDIWDARALQAMSNGHVEDEEPGRSSWWPRDLTPVLEGTWKAPEPTVGKRVDGRGLFYPGKSHTVIGESEAGKGWFALSAAMDELTADNHVLYLDFEDDENGVAGRLLTLQVKSGTITDQFHYVRPEGPLQGAALRDLDELIHDNPCTLAILDGVTEAMTMEGLNPLDNVDIAQFNGRIIRPLTDSRAAVVSLDHVTKDSQTRGRYALGGVHKLNAVSGAGYILENRSPFGIGITGRSTLKIAKDRPGQVRRHALPSKGGPHWYGNLALKSHDGQWAEVWIEAPRQRDDADRPVDLMAKIAEALIEHVELSQRQIIAAVGGKRDYVIRALDLLILDGYVNEKTPHKLLRPFNEHLAGGAK